MRLFLFLILLPVLGHGVTASEGLYQDRVIVQWNKVPNAVRYVVERAYDVPTPAPKKRRKKRKILPLSFEKVTETSSLAFTNSPLPPGLHLYKVTAFDEDGLELQAEEAHGWRKVSDQEFFLEFQKGIDSSLPRIRSMKQLNFWGERVKGWKNGELIYKTSGIIRRPIRIGITYSKFTDQYLTLTGDYEVQIFKIIGQRGKLVGTITIDGIYKGTITHDLIIEKGQSSEGGVYRVQQEGGTESILPWDVTAHPLDDSKYEENLKNTMKSAEKEGALN